MRNPVVLLLLLVLAGPVAAQPATPLAHPTVPAAMDVAGIHLVLNEEAQRLVQQKADGLSRHQPSFQARVDLADASFPIIDRVLKEEGVPLDFRYLALQESALLGDAQSVHEAVGYWQLKRETATGLGLLVNDDVDERKHLTASTRAAARYLARNNATLHNWVNALLSYNTGLSGVKPYILPTDADATEMAITEATSVYVLTLLAQKVAFEPACGLNPKPPLRLQEFPATAGQTLEAQAQLLHVGPGALAVHNRWLLASAVPADRPYTLIVPIGDVTQAAGIVANQRLQSRGELLTAPAVAANTAEVRLNDLRALIALPGETTADLAKRGGRKLREFLRDNELTAFDVAVTGRPYYLQRKRDVGAVEYYVVQPGETVFDVAQKYGIRKKAILAKNRMSRIEQPSPGRVLWLRHVRPREVAVEYRRLPEGKGIEGSATASRAMADDQMMAPEPIKTAPAHRETARAAVKRKAAPGKDEEAEASDGWGESISGTNIPPAAVTKAQPVAAPVPVPPVYTPPVRPAAPEPVAAQLPPPASAPAPAPLADEPRAAEPEVEPEIEPTVSNSPVVEPAPAVTPAPVEPPVKPAVAPAKSVIVPAAPRPITPKPAAPPVITPAATPAAVANEASHRVEPGETVYSISRRYQIPPATLMALNHLTLPANLAVGQVLVLKSQELPVPAVAAAPVVTPTAPTRPATRATNRPNPAIYVPKAAAPQAAPAPTAAAGTTIEHTVAKGETLYSIARRYEVKVADIQALNGKLDGNVKVGEVLRVVTNAKP
ncbi:LysM peptidoglycan-binding domain-containing protein [Hymenobacter sp. BT770]|uniref:LysM peptidoglycan-binding domain-containing protein n=1 Tax=Hymenobacter sp. BT770 TaxID=2886942 RepID=UPI001D1277D3|nr:LysM peptidoglycan-binding domain-containing protein [Hymenobacter sp. BT770]MCC3152843.1 LysM peptidoglycan-binding domain-containing protein [Hymenobacter sp. BT770]MDO3414918.1 LysM peptidoglycan-binding domain-containing protein [Hymenobacter sp. BT770]